MIFVTVGTHEQPFDRLVKKIDSLIGDGLITEEVFMQIGYCNYEPKHCEYSQFLSYDEMIEKVQSAHIVITHGGPASFLMPLQYGKMPIVVPRQKKFGEHVNDHQAEFCRELESRKKNILLVEEIDMILDAVNGFDELQISVDASREENNFNVEFEKIVMSIFK